MPRRVLLAVNTATDVARLRPVVDVLRADSDIDIGALLLNRANGVQASHAGAADALTRIGCPIAARADLDPPELTRTTWFQGAAQRIEHAIATWQPALVLVAGTSPLVREVAVGASAANIPLACIGTPQRAGTRDLWESQMNLRHTVVLCSWLFVDTAAEAEQLLEIGCDPQPLRVCDAAEGVVYPYRRAMLAGLPVSTATVQSGAVVARHLRDWLAGSAMATGVEPARLALRAPA